MNRHKHGVTLTDRDTHTRIFFEGKHSSQGQSRTGRELRVAWPALARSHALLLTRFLFLGVCAAIYLSSLFIHS